MSRNVRLPVYLLLWLIIPLGCGKMPDPPEVALAVRQEHNLWRAGAEIYTPQEFIAYRNGLQSARERFIRESKRIRWFRDYESVGREFNVVIESGMALDDLINMRKEQRAREFDARLSSLKQSINDMKGLSSLSPELRRSRRHITQAGLVLDEAERYQSSGRYSEALKKLDEAAADVKEAETLVSLVFNRYGDEEQVKRWRGWVRETIGQSKASGGHAIIVSKIDRQLILYKKGIPYKKYQVSLGFNGLKDKVHAGDRATPEGRYFVTKKLPNSQFYKALLINYPNADDRRQFAAAKKRGDIPKGIGIGGLIEIHGAGRNNLTNGCVGLDNDDMERLYNMVETGTPVTIVGALDSRKTGALE